MLGQQLWIYILSTRLGIGLIFNFYWIWPKFWPSCANTFPMRRELFQRQESHIFQHAFETSKKGVENCMIHLFEVLCLFHFIFRLLLFGAEVLLLISARNSSKPRYAEFHYNGIPQNRVMQNSNGIPSTVPLTQFLRDAEFWNSKNAR